MTDIKTGIILRMSSEYKHTITLLDADCGKIESIVAVQNNRGKLFHGACISYIRHKKGKNFILSQINLLNMPSYWIHKDFLFFHHVLELSDFFLPWEQEAGPVYELLNILYTDPVSVSTPEMQKQFLGAFFRCLGMYPEPEQRTIDSWVLKCIREHPQAPLLQTAHFLKIMEES